ncbi:MAG: hypothetical protein AAGA83_22215 [Cyanobacteria bacterium P01_F01_bin.116]
MTFPEIIKPLSYAVVGMLAVASPSMAIPFGDNEIDNYVGLGIRTGFNDSTSLVVDSKVEVLPLDEASVSLRPALFIGNDFEGRLPVSFDLPVDEQFLIFGGGGFAYNFDDSDFDPMVTGGVDMAVSERLVLNVEGNLIFKSNDTDAELTASINWLF